MTCRSSGPAGETRHFFGMCWCQSGVSSNFMNSSSGQCANPLSWNSVSWCSTSCLNCCASPAFLLYMLMPFSHVRVFSRSSCSGEMKCLSGRSEFNGVVKLLKSIVSVCFLIYCMIAEGSSNTHLSAYSAGRLHFVRVNTIYQYIHPCLNSFIEC